MPALATPPTVTMPRLKALTTGSPPSFMDILSNLNEGSSGQNSQLAQVDSWMYHFRYTLNKTMHMYGDDTWMRLFPGYFDQSDGVTSFFVQDTVEVDKNVTRHLESQLSHNHKWNTLILHYLGVDHIGHLEGPASPMMSPKLQEMDRVVQRIYDKLSDFTKRKTLFILLGDHGMTQAGNHGGSSENEVTTAFVLMDPAKWKAGTWRHFGFSETVNQIDLVPTLSALFGSPIPVNNVGKFITPLLDLFDSELTRSKVLENVAEQVHSLLDTSSTSSELSSLRSEYKKLTRDLLDVSFSQIQIFTARASEYLSRTFTEYNQPMIAYGLVLMFLGALISVVSVVDLQHLLVEPINLRLLGVSVIYFCSMFGSSFVEEEHEFWYYMSSSVWMIMLVREISLDRSILIICQLIILRTTNCWNPGGIKFADSGNNFRTWATSTTELFMGLIGRSRIVNTLMVLSMVGCNFLSYQRSSDNPRLPVVVTRMVSGLFVITYKLDLFFYSKLVHGQLLWMLLLTSLFMCSYLSNKNWLDITTVSQLAILLTRTHNAPLVFLLLIYIRQCAVISPSKLLMPLHLLTTHWSFFVFGNSNSIATIDISNSYVGLDGFSFQLSGLLTFMSTWIGPILTATFFAVFERDRFGKFTLMKQLLTWRTVSLFVVSLATTVFRHHIFVWSVFSPKVLYEMMWATGYSVTLIVITFFCSQT